MCGCLYRPYGWVPVQAVRVDIVRLSVCTGRPGVCPCRRLVPVHALRVSVRSYRYVLLQAVQMGICTHLTDECVYRLYVCMSVKAVWVGVCICRTVGCLYLLYG